MQIKSGQTKKPSTPYNQINSKKANNNINAPKKIIIDNSADLFLLPVQAIKNTKIYNFSGKYFDEIYEEALKIERSNGVKKFIDLNNKQKDNEIDEGEKYAKSIEDLVNKMYDDNLISNINIEQIEDNVYKFNNLEIKLKYILIKIDISKLMFHSIIFYKYFDCDFPKLFKIHFSKSAPFCNFKNPFLSNFNFISKSLNL